VGSMAIMRLTGDRLTSRAGRVPVVRFGALLAGLALAAALLLGQPAATFIAFILTGLGLANIFPLVVSAAGRTRSPALAIATVSTGGYAGVLIGPPVIGFAADLFSLPIALGLVVGLCALIAALAGLVRGDRGTSIGT
jgi:MFS family permease